MLRGEREALEWFGPPDWIGVSENNVEKWHYRLPEDLVVDGKSDFEFEVHAGRVIGFQ